MKYSEIVLSILSFLFLIALFVVDTDRSRLKKRNELLEDEPKVSLMFEYYDMYNHQFKDEFAEYELKRMSSQEHIINKQFKVLRIMVSRE